MWMLAEDAAAAARGVAPVESVRLLPGFDQYTLAATRHVEHLMPPGDFRPLIYRPQGWISAVVVVGGRIEGAWRYERKGKRLAIEVAPFAGPLAKPVVRAVEEEAERVAGFLGGSLELAWMG
jgi:hypothetical protein